MVPAGYHGKIKLNKNCQFVLWAMPSRVFLKQQALGIALGACYFGDALALGHYPTLFVNKNSPPKLS
jgi:hypothetical protein